MVKLTAAKCPNCGADIEVNENLKNSICQYCGSTILVEEAIQKVELTGKIKVEGIIGSSDKLNNARKYMRLNEYDNALNTINRVIQEDPFNFEAQALKIKCYLYQIDDEKAISERKNWGKIDEIRIIYNRMNAVDDDKMGEKELADVKDKLEQYFERSEKCKEIGPKILEYMNNMWEKCDTKGTDRLFNLIGLSYHYINDKEKRLIINSSITQNNMIYKLKEIKVEVNGLVDLIYKADEKHVLHYNAIINHFENLDDIIKILDDDFQNRSEKIEEDNTKKKMYDWYCKEINDIIQANQGIFKAGKLKKALEEKLGIKYKGVTEISSIGVDGDIYIDILNNGNKEYKKIKINPDEIEKKCEDFIEFMKK